MVSSGFWTFIQRKSSFTDAKTKLLLGIAHDRLVDQGLAFIKRGWISKEEYQDFQRYLYTPYLSLGGNGLVERLMTDVQKLPIKDSTIREIMEVDDAL
ncbi:MAG TPA: hypothetical protein PKD68_00125 [Candidatus Saccharibacteria bacterium]|nr:hypothetical protein [Candidatus Saccharibacteria bacterium]